MDPSRKSSIYLPNHVASLEACSQSLESCSLLTNASIATLSTATQDVPRMKLLLQNRRCYEVVTETEVRNAQYQLTSEMEPQIKTLIERAEGGLMKLQKRERTLKEKVDRRKKLATTSSVPPSSSSSETTAEANARLKKLRKEKEDLLKVATKLENEIKRKERMLNAMC